MLRYNHNFFLLSVNQALGIYIFLIVLKIYHLGKNSNLNFLKEIFCHQNIVQS